MKATLKKEYNRRFSELRLRFPEPRSLPDYRYTGYPRRLKDTYDNLLEIFSWLRKQPLPLQDDTGAIITSISRDHTKKGPENQLLQWTVDVHFSWEFVIDSGISIETHAEMMVKYVLEEYQYRWGDE